MANEIIDTFRKITTAIKSDVSRRRALTSIFGPHRERIFSKGQAADGSQIGTYKPETAKRKTKRGRNPGFVNLRDSDQMYADYGIVQNGGEFGFGFQNEFNADKMRWNSDRYGKEIAALSDDEFQRYVDVLLQELNSAL